MADIAQLAILMKAKDQASDKMKGLGQEAASTEQKLTSLGTAATVMGAAIMAAITSSIMAFTSLGDQLQKLSLRTGISVEALSEMKYIAERSGVNIDMLAKAVQKLQRAVVEAEEGTETYVSAFERIGISVDDLKGKSPEELFYTVATALNVVEDHGTKVATAMDLMGGAGERLMPIFASTSEELQNMRDRAEELNLVFTEDSANAAAEFNDRLDDLKDSLKMLMATFGELATEVLLPMIEKLTDIIAKVTDWAKEHETLSKILVRFGVILGGMLVIGGPMMLFVAQIPKMIAGIGTLVTAIRIRLIPALVQAIARFIAMLASMGPAGWAMVAGSVAAAAAGIAAMNKLLSEREEEAVKNAEAIAGAQDKIASGYASLSPERQAGFLKALEAKGISIEAYAKPEGYQYGGRVPGPIGAPVPIIAHGGEEYLGPYGGGGGGRSVSIVIPVQNYMGDERSKRALVRDIQLMLREEDRRTQFHGVNTGYHFGRSSI